MNEKEYHAKRAALLRLGNSWKHHTRTAREVKPRLVSRAKAKSGRKANRQEMHEFWRNHLQYNPAIM